MMGSLLLLIFLFLSNSARRTCSFSIHEYECIARSSLKSAAAPASTRHHRLYGWVQRQEDGEWEWEEDDPSYVPPPLPFDNTAVTPDATAVATTSVTATPRLPSKTYKPKQSLGQNYLKDGNTVAKILRAFHSDMTYAQVDGFNADGLAEEGIIVELGPGAGALTDKLVEAYGCDRLQCIEIDDRSIQILRERHPELSVRHDDVLQVDYPEMAAKAKRPLAVIGNLPYYITSQILFALADAAHAGAIRTATVTMQWEVAQRMVASTRTKDYGILSVVFQTYCSEVNCHFKIPPTVFYPKPKVDSALVGLHFLRPPQLRERLAGVRPAHLRRVVTTAFQQRRKTLRNSLKKLCRQVIAAAGATTEGDDQAEAARSLLDSPPLPVPAVVLQAQADGDAFAATQQLPHDWASKRPEELSPGQFIELTRRIFGPSPDDESVNNESYPLGYKVWRKLRHGKN